MFVDTVFTSISLGLGASHSIPGAVPSLFVLSVVMPDVSRSYVVGNPVKMTGCKKRTQIYPP